MGDYILSLNASLSDIAAHAVANTRVPPGCFLLQDSALLRVGVSEDHPGAWQLRHAARTMTWDSKIASCS